MSGPSKASQALSVCSLTCAHTSQHIPLINQSARNVASPGRVLEHKSQLGFPAFARSLLAHAWQPLLYGWSCCHCDSLWSTRMCRSSAYSSRTAGSAGDCLIVGTALAQSVPAKVLDVFSGTELLWPQSLMQTTPLGVASSGSTLRFVEQSVPALRELQKVVPTP